MDFVVTIFLCIETYMYILVHNFNIYIYIYIYIYYQLNAGYIATHRFSASKWACHYYSNSKGIQSGKLCRVLLLVYPLLFKIKGKSLQTFKPCSVLKHLASYFLISNSSVRISNSCLQNAKQCIRKSCFQHNRIRSNHQQCYLSFQT